MQRGDDAGASTAVGPGTQPPPPRRLLLALPALEQPAAPPAAPSEPDGGGAASSAGGVDAELARMLQELLPLMQQQRSALPVLAVSEMQAQIGELEAGLEAARHEAACSRAEARRNVALEQGGRALPAQEADQRGEQQLAAPPPPPRADLPPRAPAAGQQPAQHPFARSTSLPGGSVAGGQRHGQLRADVAGLGGGLRSLSLDRTAAAAAAAAAAHYQQAAGPAAAAEQQAAPSSQLAALQEEVGALHEVVNAKGREAAELRAQLHTLQLLHSSAQMGERLAAAAGAAAAGGSAQGLQAGAVGQQEAPQELLQSVGQQEAPQELLQSAAQLVLQLHDDLKQQVMATDAPALLSGGKAAGLRARRTAA
jgi:hypothetical protein